LYKKGGNFGGIRAYPKPVRLRAVSRSPLVKG